METQPGERGESDGRDGSEGSELPEASLDRPVGDDAGEDVGDDVASCRQADGRALRGELTVGWNGEPGGERRGDAGDEHGAAPAGGRDGPAPVAGDGPAPVASDAGMDPSPAFESDPPQAGFRLRSELEDRGALGWGGMAEVRRVFDRFLRRMVAAKILRPGMSDSARRRFIEEARITGQLEHPNIIPVHALAADRFTMKLVHGETLAEKLEGLARPPRNDALADIVRQLLKVCDALAFAHSKGVLHRDIKPENIMLGRFGEVYLVDWGVALVRRDGEGGELANAVVGTPAFMSPEAAAGEVSRVDERTDVFGLGAVLYEVLTGCPPHTGDDAQEVLRAARRCEIRAPHTIRAADGQPAVLCDIAMRAMALDPVHRYQSIEQMREELEAFLQSGAWFVRREVEAGADIVREGEPGIEAYLIERGRCEVYRGRGELREVLRSMGPGDVFGELALIARDVRTASVRASEDVSLLVISADALEHRFPTGSWPRQFLDTLARRFADDERVRR